MDRANIIASIKYCKRLVADLRKNLDEGNWVRADRYAAMLEQQFLNFRDDVARSSPPS